uniref:Protein kinase domain-containing protein n=1 Tax=Acrobeloides nanus TaxID=290746 RepID=A0A914CYL7_9BILA
MFYVKGFHYKESDLLGSGTFGKVYKAFNPDTKQSSAIKKIEHGQRGSKQELEIFQKLQSIENENLIKLIDFDIHGDSMFLILELGDLTLKEYLIEHDHLKEHVVHQFFRDIANGLRALKNANIIHRDIKPENILLCNKKSLPTPAPKDYVVKLADFGTSRFLQLGELAQTFCGTITYMAPEIQLRKRYNNSADLWSTGLLLLRCIAGADCFLHTISVMEDDLATFFLEYENSAKSLPLHFNSDCEISNGLKKIIEGLLI